MKKVFAIALIAASFVACNEGETKVEEVTTTDTNVIETPKVDTSLVITDTTVTTTVTTDTVPAN